MDVGIEVDWSCAHFEGDRLCVDVKLCEKERGGRYAEALVRAKQDTCLLRRRTGHAPPAADQPVRAKMTGGQV